jgi:hypothetical protein
MPGLFYSITLIQLVQFHQMRIQNTKFIDNLKQSELSECVSPQYVW